MKSGNPRLNCKTCSKKTNRKRYREKHDLKLKVKKIKNCKSCDIEVSSKKYCNDCKNFVNYRKLFSKFNVTEKNLLTANQIVLKLLIDEYFIKNMSLIDIKNKYNIMYNTIHFYFKKKHPNCAGKL